MSVVGEKRNVEKELKWKEWWKKRWVINVLTLLILAETAARLLDDWISRFSAYFQ